jgi:hypothetical protein
VQGTGTVALHELVEVDSLDRLLLQRKVLVGAEVVDPEPVGPGFGRPSFLSKKITFAFTPGEYQIPVGRRTSFCEPGISAAGYAAPCRARRLK